MKRTSWTALALWLAVASGCSGPSCPEALHPIEGALLERYHAESLPAEAPAAPEAPDNGKFSIFLDYSSGMKVAFADATTAKFYEIFINSLKITQADFHEVDKLDVVKLPDLPKSELYKKIKDFSRFSGINAPLGKALDQMVLLDGQSVLITDGELWDNGERNDPWAREAFSAWLKAGNQIDVWVTDHVEKDKSKHLFYLFFTPARYVDDREGVANQFRFHLENSSEARGLSFEHFSFSNQRFRMVNRYPSRTEAGANPNLVLDQERYAISEELGFEFQSYFLGWSDMVKYVRDAYDEQGRPVPNGEAVLQGLFLDATASQFYRAEELEIRVQDLKEDWLAYQLADRCRKGPGPTFALDDNGKPLLDEAGLPIVEQPGEPDCYDENGRLLVDTARGPAANLPLVQELFWLDDEAFRAGLDKDGLGQVVIKMHPQFNGSQLSGECSNLHRVQIFLKRASPMTDNPALEKLKWDGLQVARNTSLYDSVLGALNDANPQGRLLYTFYIETPANDYYP